MKMALGIVIGIAGAILLASLVVQASFVDFIGDDLALRFVFSIVGLFLIQMGYRLFTSARQANKGK